MTGGSEAAAASLTFNGQAINLISAVEELNGLTPQELNKLLRESESSTLRYITSTGSPIQIDLERLASSLPLHLIAVLSSAGENDNIFSYFGEVGLPLTYFLRGLRLLHSLADLASRHTRFEQIVLEEVRVSEQILDLVFYSLLVLAHYKQEIGSRVSLSLLHSGLVACCLYLLNCCISSNWQDLVLVLLAHPKVDVFMDVAFDAIHIDIKFLDSILSTLTVDVLNEKLSLSAAEKTAICVCQHCEASLQFVLSLCQQKLFRDRVLKNKELCGNGGILSLAQTILDLNIQHCFESLEMIAGLSRLKSKVLSILLQLCEAEDISYLDEVARSPKSMNLAKSVVLKILDLLRVALGKEAQQLSDSFDQRKPKGLVLLNSMRLADIFSDDSNFRSFFMANITTVLAEILGMAHEKFLSNWCSNDAPVVEEDAILHYDPYTASGTVLVNLSIDPEGALPVSTRKEIMETASLGTLTNIPLASYAQQRTSYLVKVIANLHCFVPNICEEQEKDLFLNKFFEFLCIDKVKLSSGTSAPEIQKASSICTNLCSLTVYARSLIPNFLIEEDVGLLSLFYSQLCELIPSQHSMQNPMQDVTSHKPTYSLDADTKITGVPQTSIYPQEHKFHPDEKHKVADDGINNLPQKEKEHNDGHIGFVDAKTRGNMSSMEESSQAVENSKEADALKISQEPETVACEEKQPRKRKRNIMNDRQITLIENALLDEPEMQRNAALLQSWAEKLSLHGSELTSSQLKNWLNNRKARLARAAREVRAPSEGENAYDKSVASSISHYYDSPDSGGEDSYRAG